MDKTYFSMTRVVLLLTFICTAIFYKANAEVLCTTPTPVISPDPVSVCASALTQSFTVTDATGQLLGGSTVTWTITGVPGSLSHTITSSSATTQVISVTLPTGITSISSYTVTVSVNNHSCTVGSDNTTLTVNPNPSITGLPASIPLCGGGTYNLAAVAGGGVSPYTYAWTNSNTGAGTLSASNVSNPTFTAATVSATSTTNLGLTVTNNATPAPACSTVVSIPVTVNPTPAPVLSTAGPLCEGTNATITVSPTGGTYAWSVSGTGSSIVGSSTASSVVVAENITTTALSQNVTVSLVQTVGGCPSASVQTIVRFDNTPTTSAAGTDIPLCSPATTTTLAGNTATVGTGAWTQTAGPTSTISASGSPTSGVTGLAGGSPTNTYTYTWTISNGACPVSADPVNVTVTTTPSPVLSTAGPLCEGTNATISVTPTGGTYAWSVSGAGSSIVGASNASSVVVAENITTTALSQNVTVSLIQTINSCPSASVQTIVRFDNTPTVSAAGTDIPLCSPATTTTLAGNTATVGTGAWTQTAGPTSTISASGSPTSGVTGLAGGSPTNTYTYTWTISNGACPVSADPVNVTVTSAPTPTLTGLNPTCENSANVYTVSPAGGTYAWTTTGWTVTSGGGLNDNTVTASATVSSASTASQNNTISVIQTLNGCPSAPTQIIVQVDNIPTTVLNALTADQCAATSVNLDASTSSSFGVGVWSQTPSAGSTITSTGTGTATASSFTGSTTAVASNTYSFTYSITNGACAAVTATQSFNNYNPVSITAADVSVCNASLASVSASVTPSVLTGTWTGTGVTFTAANANSTDVNGIVAAPSTVTVTYTVNNVACSSFDDVIITNLGNSTSAPDGDDHICQTVGIASLNIGTSTSSPTVTWTILSQPSGANATITSPGSGTTDVTNMTVVGTYTFNLEVPGVSTCAAANGQVDVIVDASIIADALDVDRCGLTGGINLNATGAGTWSTVSALTIDSPTSNATTLSGLTSATTGQFVFTWTVANGTCQDTDDATLTIDGAPVATVTALTARCETDVTPITLDAGASEVGVWSITSGTGTITDVNAINTTLTGVTAGTPTVATWTVQSQYQICANATATVTIDVEAAPASDAGPDFSTCLTGTALTANTTTAGTWTVTSGTGTFADDNDPTTTVSGLSTGVNTFVWTVDGTVCADATSDVIITNTTADLDVTVTGDADTLCVGAERHATVSVTSTSGSGDYQYYWSDQNGAALFNTDEPIVSFVPGAGVTTYYVVVADLNQVGCTADIDSVKIAAVAEQSLTIPNLMTPNNDTWNDELKILDENENAILPGSYLQVVNRWGEQVFESEDYRNTWKAPNTSDGMYFYYLKAGCGGRVYKGWIQILANNKP